MIDRTTPPGPAGPRPEEADESGRRVQDEPRGASGDAPHPGGAEPPFSGMGGGLELEVWETLGRWRAEGRVFALLTVVESSRFTPRKAGAHMLVAEGGEIFGTIGGGAIEHEAIATARELLEGDGGSTILRRHLTQELGMCCGGEMAVYVEVIEQAPALTVFGAGNVSRALVALAIGCGFRVTVVDGRPEWARADRFPGARVVCQEPEDFARANAMRPRDYAVVITHDHALDHRLVQTLLAHPLRFLGMIGSLPKQRKFALRLRARGFSDEQIARLHTPLGISIGASTPEEIAVSAMAQLIAVRRGVPIAEGWVPPARAGVAAAEREA